MRRIASDTGVEDLADLILDTNRQKPICVVSSDADGNWRLTGEQIEEEVGEVAEIFEIPNGVLTYRLEDRLPGGSVVFGGAVRVYPPEFAKNPSPELAPLFQFTSDRGAKNKLQRISYTIWTMARGSGLLEPVGKQVFVEGTVKSLLNGGRAFIELAGGTLAVLRQEVSFPDVPLEWVLSVGDKISGSYDSKLSIFQPQSATLSAAELLAHFGDRAVTLGLVKETSRTEAKIALLPAVVFNVAKDHISGNPMDVIDRYLDEGDVVRVRIYRDEQGRPALRMDDIEDDEETSPSLALLPQGRPWLEEGRYAPWREQDFVEEIVVPDAVRQVIDELLDEPVGEVLPTTHTGPIPRPPGVQPAILPVGAAASAPSRKTNRDWSLQIFMNKQNASQLDLLKNTVAYLEGELTAASRQIQDLVREKEDAVGKYRDARSELASLKKTERAEAQHRSTTRSRRDRFASDEEWFDEEVRRAWIGRYKPQERSEQFPLDRTKYEYAGEFFESISPQRLDESELRKLVRVVLDLVTGRQKAEHVREVHPLYDGGGKPLTSPDGAPCMRVHLENGVPQAKRFHYYQLKDGRVRLGWVALHDEDLD